MEAVRLAPDTHQCSVTIPSPLQGSPLGDVVGEDARQLTGLM